MVRACEENESIKKVESFQKLQAQVNDILLRKDTHLIKLLTTLSLDNLDHPLNTVAAISKGTLRKILDSSTKEKIFDLMRGDVQKLQSRGYKSRFLALNLIIDYIDPFLYIQEENPMIIREIIESTTETVTTGKYVLNFFETLLKRAFGRTNEQEKKWFDIWIDEYLRALRSDNEALRDAVCTLITPIVIKINKNSLPFILSLLLTEDETNLTMQILEQIITLLKIARSNKMLVIDDDQKEIRLDNKCQNSLNQLRPDLPQFKLRQDILLKLVLSENFRICLDCIEIVAMETKASQSVSKFEYEMVEKFIKHCLRTTFPEFRQKYIKAVKQFLIRLRTVSDKDIKKYIASDQCSDNLKTVIEFITNILNFVYDNLYLDKPVEGALPYFEIFKIIIELFGDFEYKLRITQVYPACFLLSKTGLLNNDSFFIFLLNSLKSTWTQIRLYAYQVLIRYPDSYPLFNDKKFINEVLLATGSELANNPKAMMAEASALFHNLLFNKCLKHIHFIEGDTSDVPNMQLQFLSYVNNQIKNRLKTFQVALIKEGRKDALLHGYLSFFKHLFLDFKLSLRPSTESPEAFAAWRAFIKDLISTILLINQTCKGLISNNGLMSESEDPALGDIQVDCRGHPINMTGAGDVEIEDYENFILVGVWLAVKENGITLYNLLKWLEFPSTKEDNTKFIEDEDIHRLSESFLDMLFNFKHRGAIEKAAESFSLFCQKLLELNDQYYKQLPSQMLDRALDKITTENLSTILRRSAGIPPTIIAILRAEPLSSEPLLLNKTLAFLLDIAETATREDSKVHALNIMRFIFQDSLLRHDIQSFITPAMILATDSFSSNSWSIRNSALMAFTALTKRLLNNLHVQDQDLSRTKGLTVWEFLSKYARLSDYFQGKLREGISLQSSKNKQEKEKQDLVIFSILLLLSRLIPSFQLVDFNTEEEGKNSDSQEESKVEANKAAVKNRDKSIQEYVELIKHYSSNPTYFVRKISAQSLLPFIQFDSYVSEIKATFDTILNSITSDSKIRANAFHGLAVRLNVFISAYFQYRDLNSKQLGPGHHHNLAEHRQSEENLLLELYTQFENAYDQAITKYSKVSIALLIKTYQKVLSNVHSVEITEDIINKYAQRFEQVVAASSLNSGDRLLLTADDQILLQEISKLLVIVSIKNMKQKKDNKELYEKTIINVFVSIVSKYTDDASDFVYQFLNQFYSNTKRIEEVGSAQLLSTICEFLINEALPKMTQKDEKYCKVSELLLKITYRFLKNQIHLSDSLTQTLITLKAKFTTNPSILSQLVKLFTLGLKHQIQNNRTDLISTVTEMISEYSYMDQKEQVRIAVSKALGKLIPYLRLEEGSVFLQNEIAFRGFMSLLYSLIILLNDEQPDIRYYLCESGLSQILDSQFWQIQEGLEVQLNDCIVLELIMNHLSTRILSHSNEDLRRLYANDFLLKQWILFNPYREHLAKNYEDKIFFFEPINKFYDLLWIKRIAYQQLQRFSEYIDQTLISSQNEPDFLKNLAVYYSAEHILKQNSTQMERLSQGVMLERLKHSQSNEELSIASIKQSIPSETENFIKALVQ